MYEESKILFDEECWDGDLLDRKKVAEYLTSYIESQYEYVNPSASFVLNINAEWGVGKSFLIERWVNSLKKTRFVVNFNAWESDQSLSPLLTFISDLTEQISVGSSSKRAPAVSRKINQAKRLGGRIASNWQPILIAMIAKQLVGSGYQKLLADTDDEEKVGHESDNGPSHEVATKLLESLANSTIQELKEKKDSIKKFKKVLIELLNEIQKDKTKDLPLYVFVDELDRCRPNYAVEVLENIKHLFNLKGIVFVVCTDTSQLAHSVNALYGAGFDSRKYLSRFFDIQYQIPLTLSQQLVDIRFREIEDSLALKVIFPYSDNFSNPQEVCDFIFRLVYDFKLNPRDFGRVWNLVKAVLFTGTRSEYENDISLIFCLSCIYYKNPKSIADMLEAKDESSFINVYRHFIKNREVYGGSIYSDHRSHIENHNRELDVARLLSFYWSMMSSDARGFFEQDYNKANYFLSGLFNLYRRRTKIVVGHREETDFANIERYFSRVQQAGHFGDVLFTE
ncbi:KAP family NTPase [bacterium]|nr:KAP family NTPase [bacterium]